MIADSCNKYPGDNLPNAMQTAGEKQKDPFSSIPTRLDLSF